MKKYLIYVALTALIALPFVSVHPAKPASHTVSREVALAKPPTPQAKPKVPTPPTLATAVTATTTISAVPKTVVAPPPVAPTTYPTGCSNYLSDFEQYNWDVAVAMAICQAESSGNPYAISSTADYGIMQIHDGLQIYGTQIYNPAFNISVAYNDKYLTQGWEAWDTWLSGAYLKYL